MFTRNSSSLLDIVCMDNDLNVLKSGSIDTFTSTDHRLVYATVNIEFFKSTPKTITYRNFRNFNKDQFDMHQMSFQEIFQSDCIDNKLNLFNQQIISIFDVHAPYKTVKIQRKYRPYITETIKEMIKLKKKAFNKYKRTNLPCHKNFYLDLKNYLRFAIKSEKKAYMSFHLQNSHKNSKKMWSNINEWNVHSKPFIGIPEHLKNVNRISDHFAGVSQKMAIPVNDLVLEYYSNNKISSENDQCIFRNVTDLDVYKSFSRIKSKGMGADGLSYDMILFCLNYIAPVITHLFNWCLRKGVFPTIWKTSLVRPLPKTSKVNSVEELRPICLLPILAKMHEIIVFDIISEYASVKKIIPKVQSGFQKFHSTATALTKVTSDIAQNIDENKVSCLVLLAYSKAFDLINHNMLIAKFGYYGFSDEICFWLTSYLRSRAQIVTLDGERSESVTVENGVPQGSILGPLLFKIYTSDLPGVIKNCSIHLYADDTQLLGGFDPTDSCVAMRNMISDLSAVYKWSRDHGLLLNAKKSCHMIIGTKVSRTKYQLNNFVTLHVGNTPLPLVEESRNLGVIFDSQLNFEKHVDKKLALIYYKLKSLYPFRDSLPVNIKLLLVESLLYPQLDYCNVVYYNFLTEEYKSKIQLVQNACLRFVYSIRKYDHISYIYLANDLLKYEYRVRLHFGVLVYKIYKFGCPSYLWECFIKRREMHNLNLRNVDTFQVPNHRTSRFKNSFVYLATKLLNSDIFTSLVFYSLKGFKTKFKQNLLQNM